MRNILLMSAAVIGLNGGAALAQSGTGSTQTPPSPSASSQMPQPMNSAPAGAATSAQTSPGTALGQSATPPMHHPMGRAGMAHRMPRGMAHPPMDSADAGDNSAPPTSAYRGGVGSPLSTRAANLSSSKTRSEMGSRLPDPAAASNTPEALLAAAQRALNLGKTGAAQEALERAETRVLSRTTDPAMANTPDSQAMVQNISAARHALGANDVKGAKQAIQMAMNAPVPPTGPAVTVTYPQGGMTPMPGTPPTGY